MVTEKLLNVGCFEESGNYWEKIGYDKNGNIINFENSNGVWYNKEYDKNNNLIYKKDSDGYWEKMGYDSNENINEISEEATKKSNTHSKKRVKKKRRKVKLSNEQLKEIIERIRMGERGETIKSKFKLGDKNLYRIKKELNMPRKLKGESIRLPDNYFNPKNIRDRVNNILFDMGYI